LLSVYNNIIAVGIVRKVKSYNSSPIRQVPKAKTQISPVGNKKSKSPLKLVPKHESSKLKPEQSSGPIEVIKIL
jgi:hypothetical protein